MIFGEAMLWLADGTEDSIFQVLLAADVVDHSVFDRVIEQAIDGEIASLGVFLGGGEADGGWTAAVFIRDIRTERRDFDNAFPLADEDDAESRADSLCVAKQLANALGRGIGGDVVILGIDAEEPVADAAAGEVGNVTALAKALDDGQGVWAMAWGPGGWGILGHRAHERITERPLRREWRGGGSRWPYYRNRGGR